MSAKFEYTVVKLPVVTKTREHDITELLNRVAAPAYGRYGQSEYASKRSDCVISVDAVNSALVCGSSSRQMTGNHRTTPSSHQARARVSCGR